MKRVHRQEWSMVRGDTLSFTVEIDGFEEHLDSLTFTCKQKLYDKIIFQKTLGDGCSEVELGKYQVRVAPEDTANVSPGDYAMDLEIKWNSSTDVATLFSGRLRIIGDETSNESGGDPDGQDEG